MRVKLILLLLTYSFIGFSKLENVLYIEPGSHSQTNGPPNRTLEYYARLNRSNTPAILHFLSGNHTLSSILKFAHTTYVSLIANNSGETVLIQCKGQARLVFEYVSTLTIEGIQFIGCGVVNSQVAVEINHCYGTMSNVSVASSRSGAVYINNSTISFENLIIDNNKLNYTEKGFSAIKVESSNIQLTGTTTISENNAFSEQNIANIDCGPGHYNYKKFESVTVKFADANLTVTGTLIITKNVGLSGTMIFENSNFQMTGKSFFSQNIVCIKGALSLVDSTASLSNSTHFINNTGSGYYYVGMITTAGIAMRRSTLSMDGVTLFTGNKADVATIETFTSNIKVAGELVTRDNSATYAGIIVRDRSNMIVTGKAEFTNNKYENAVMRAEGSNFTSNYKISFTRNTGIAPCLTYQGGHYHFKGTTTFENNAGILNAEVAGSFSFEGNSTFITNNVRDFSLGGGMWLLQSTLFLAGNYSFERNRLTDVDGGAIYADQSRIVLGGHGRFVRNAARYGGAIYLQNNSTILLEPGVNLEFTENAATKGGALFLYSSVRKLSCENVAPTEGSFCLIQNYHTIGENQNITFQKNIATKGGSIVHMKFVEEIDIVEHSISTRALESLTQNSHIVNNTSPIIDSDSFRLCFCENNKPVCNISVKQFKQMIRGQRITVNITAVTLIKNNSLSVRSYLKSSPSKIKSLDGDIQHLGESCTDVEYRVYSDGSEESVIICADESCEEASDAKLVLQIEFEDCPLGFATDRDKCICDKDIFKDVTDVCNVDEKTISKTSKNFWIGSQNNSTSIFYLSCPFDYCTQPPVDVDPLIPDTQCRNNRSGILCGGCKTGTSLVLGSSKCKECSNNFTFLLIILFAILGILLVTFLFFFQLTVSSGTIHGLILYTSVVKANSATLHLQNINGLTVFAAWFNLDFGIETCFHKGMDQLSKTGWQFVFPIYLWLLVGLVIVICHYSVRASRFFSTSNPVEVLATVILLSYTKLLQNIISIFSATSASYSLHSNSPVWLYDGNVLFGQGVHAVLIVVGLFTLLFLFLPYTFVLTFAQLLEKNTKISMLLSRLRLTPFISAYQAPYKSGSRSWVGACLLLRCVLLSIVAAGRSESIGLLATIYLSILLVSVIGMMRGIYSKYWQDILEVSYILNLGLLAATIYHLKETYPSSANEYTIGIQVIVYVSMIAAYLTFIAVIIKQSYSQLMKSPQFKRKIESVKKKISEKKARDENISPPTIELHERKVSIATCQELMMTPGDDNEHPVVELREPMLDFN